VRLIVTMIVILAGCQPGELSKHQRATERILTQRGAPDFADASTAEVAAIRHTPSGMICVLPEAGAFEFDVFPATGVNAGGQCSSTQGEVVTAWVAVNFRERTTLDVAFSSAVAQLTNGLSAQPWRGQPSEADRASPEGLPHYRRISMAEQDGWYLQQIVSSPLSEAPAAEDLSGASWRAGLQAFAEARREQAAPGQ
jgi:hypothetical protein